jgi:indolepyruvate ferredoxin oxidoreductase beta subunit
MQYIVVGLGGQGILFSSKVLGHIALSRNSHVMGSEVHGMAQRGGSVVSHFKIGEYASPLVRVGDADLLLAFDQNEGFRNLHFLRPGGHALINLHEPQAAKNEHLQKFIQERDIHLHTLPGYDILRQHMGGRFLFLNVLLLGAMGGARVSDITPEELREAIEALSPEKFRKVNLDVLELGRAFFGP